MSLLQMPFLLQEFFFLMPQQKNMIEIISMKSIPYNCTSTPTILLLHTPERERGFSC